MNKIFNGILCVFKFLLLFCSFALTFYVILNMYHRLEKSFFEALDIFIPYLILFILFSINHIFEQKNVTSNLFYNLTSCLVFLTFIVVGYRAIFDVNMVMNGKTDYNINFGYFADFVAPMKSMMFLLIGSNILLIISNFFGNNKSSNSKKNIGVTKEVTVIEENA